MGASGTPARVYARREPEKDVLYRVVAANVETFAAAAHNADAAGLHRHVKRELYGYLGCPPHGARTGVRITTTKIAASSASDPRSTSSPLPDAARPSGLTVDLRRALHSR